MEKNKINCQKHMQKKIKEKFISKLIICETAILSISLPVMIIKNSPEPVKLEKMISNDKTVERVLDKDVNLPNNYLVIKTKWQLNNDGYSRNVIKYQLANMTEEEITNLMKDKDALISLTTTQEGERYIEYTKELIESDQNDEIEALAYIYETDGNYTVKKVTTTSEKVIMGLVMAYVMIGAGFIAYNRDIIQNESRNEQIQNMNLLSDEEIKDNKYNINKCLRLARSKKHKKQIF